MNRSAMIGIDNIEFLPGNNNREVVSYLSASLKSAAALRAAVAYWCVGPKEFGPDLVKRLGGDGFLCVDIHLPTDIDVLSKMVSSGANVFLYLKNPNPQPDEWKMHVPPHLMHPKLLLFDYNAEPAELWVGSHNWTARALTGVNIEASLRIRLENDCSLYNDAVAFLDGVRTKCVPFDLAAVDYYKWLQRVGPEEGVWVLELRGSRSVLEAHKKLTIFGQTEAEYKNLKNVDKNLVVSLLEPGTIQEILYEAVVSDTGHLSGAGLAFDSRLYAAHDGSPRPNLLGPVIPPPAVRRTAKSWATIGLIERLVGVTFEMPPAVKWITEKTTDEKLPSWLDLKNWFPKPEKPLVQKAVPKEAFETGHAGTDLTPLSQSVGSRNLPRAGARALESPQLLLRKKIVRAERSDGTTFTVGRQKGSKEKTEE